MTTIVERDNTSDSSALAVILVIALLVAVGLGIAYMNGAFSGSSTKENTTIIERNNTTTAPAPANPAPSQGSTPAP